ncbi:MAG: LL-diaminopimelate aminotransferase [Omnitrophica WOR_2 bacterium RIFCSPLOWO2_02_FULL_63_16]|nr:MAG: LL-diaminopimelate aminotransferase [Omnitrophica WOR_2 bacterium GWA2_63_20]OGX17353.1 MAG: LL-diaminopimelate aminotransferase [Omnitrophica WOR_2 bacterium GWF2_63_9]OGX32815.1 MAG: LL-diaminopimelate aminotransferase [Omnitrophica WOR_2 bacterium RIFCSPHIGHO2_12_FULL_64_13]OGX36589.1 MAG: LL-diaminopimelate aminotransferase [Omnitrophica WOR_2 bacterium RIFCSPHIGHO2_02_FULL_63_39]OGX46017.1 MAG: LL-diaminopimelate aminotransferase [Omnitrophica WOR_2 bacterium RIFCSPLOWO2_02_FULL_63
MTNPSTTSWAIEKAQRLQQLPPYLFVEIDKAKRRLIQQGVDVIDLGVGDPDLPTPPAVIKTLQETAEDPANHRYSFTEGLSQLRQAIAGWYQRRFNVILDPATEVLPLLGSKEGIAHLPLALANPGDVVLVPDPCYPPYRSGTTLAGASVSAMPLLEENGFLPDFGSINQKAARSAKLLFLNYPNNPTAALATEACFQEAIELANAYQVVIAHDAAYSEIAFDGVKPISFLQVPGAKEVGVEFHSLSKTYQMTGWRVGWVCGHAKVVAALGELKSNLDSGIFQPIQFAAIEALRGDQASLGEAVATYQQRRDVLVEGLAKSGWEIPKPKAAFYVWATVPGGGPSIDFAARVLEQAHVVITPGVGFGAHGEGYVRFSLTVPTDRLQEAVSRIANIL